MHDDVFALQRFLDAQESVDARARRELSSGKKTTHWMWYVFPQIAGLGHSAMSKRYAITGRAEATAYLAHPTLGRRLRECTAIVVGLQKVSAHQLFGSPDDVKFQSCMTLFAEVGHEPLFASALQRFYGGLRDGQTVRLLESRDAQWHWRTSDK